VSLNIRDCELTAGFRMPLSGFNERSTKLVSKLLSVSQTGKTPADISLAILHNVSLVHPMLYYAEAGVEITHGQRATSRHGNFDYVREF
jgi:hypothetical protein